MLCPLPLAQHVPSPLPLQLHCLGIHSVQKFLSRETYLECLLKVNLYVASSCPALQNEVEFQAMWNGNVW